MTSEQKICILTSIRHLRILIMDRLHPIDKTPTSTDIHFRVNYPSQWDYLDQFYPIGLNEIGSAELLDRKDTKYILRNDHLQVLLSGLETKYRILEIQGRRRSHYKTSYYDTPDYSFFHQHQNGAGQRWKIRQRSYLDSNLSYLEVKFKDNRKRTWKKRLRIIGRLQNEIIRSNKFLISHSPYTLADLNHCLDVWYTRTTLVRKDYQERITLDNQLFFYKDFHSYDLSGLMVIEVKQGVYDPQSPFMAHLKENKVHPTRFSKYCIGTIFLNPAIKHNRFKSILHKIDSLLGEGYQYERAH